MAFQIPAGMARRASAPQTPEQVLNGRFNQAWSDLTDAVEGLALIIADPLCPAESRGPLLHTMRQLDHGLQAFKDASTQMPPTETFFTLAPEDDGA